MLMTLISGCGSGRSSRLLTAADVQSAFLKEGLTTHVVGAESRGECASITKTVGGGASTSSPVPCAMLAGVIGLHVIALVSETHTVGGGNLESVLDATVLDSVAAANDYEISPDYCPAARPNCAPTFARLQTRNVVVRVLTSGRYQRKAAAALATLS